jgi:hypothetical protein
MLFILHVKRKFEKDSNEKKIHKHIILQPKRRKRRAATEKK